MDRKEYIKKLWNANTAIDIANILEDFENEVKNNVALGDVSNRRELLLAYEQSKCPKTWWMSKSQAECEVEDFLANNCG